MKITKGKYKMFGSAEYRGERGTEMAYIKLKGIKHEKQVRLTSIELLEPVHHNWKSSTPRSTSTTSSTSDGDVIHIKRSTYDELVQEVNDMRAAVISIAAAMSKLESKVTKLGLS